MKLKIDYPTAKEIEQQKERVMERAFSRPLRRPPPHIVFFQCELSAVISLAIYFCLMFFCASVRPEREANGFLALAVFPLTYFSFYFLSILSEEQSEVVDLKCSMRYSFGYLVSLRMLYASLAAVILNLAMLLLFFRGIEQYWSVGAAGTTSTLLLALITLISFEKTNSLKLSAVIVLLWTSVCLILMQFGESLYHLMIDVIPITVHIVAMVISFLSFMRYIGKVEKQNAYGF